MNLAKAAFFDGQVQAPWAAAAYGAAEAPKIGRLLKEARILPGHRILQPGCGTGRLTAVLAEAVGSHGTVVALDISSGMLAACERRTAGCTNVRVLHASLEECAPGGGPFDRVVCHQVFPHFDDPALAVRRIAELLAPDGLVVVAHFLGAAAISARHRDTGGPIAEDRLPARQEMERLFSDAGLCVDLLTDDDLGYFLRATRARD